MEDSGDNNIYKNYKKETGKKKLSRKKNNTKKSRRTLRLR